MKTAEEILENIMCCTIEEDADLDVKSNYYYQHDDVVKSIEQAQKEAYTEGYNEAMRWRDPKVELPLNHNAVFVKYKTQKGALKYGVGRYLDIGMGNPWTIEGSVSREIIGWKSNEIS